MVELVLIDGSRTDRLCSRFVQNQVSKCVLSLSMQYSLCDSNKEDLGVRAPLWGRRQETLIVVTVVRVQFRWIEVTY